MIGKNTQCHNICIYSPSAYSLLTDEIGHSGGAELQLVTLAKGLMRKGFDVSLIIYNEKATDIPSNIDGINIVKIPGLKTGIPIIRFFYPKAYSIWKALKKANSEIYISRTASFETGIIAKFCQMNYKKYIFSAAHDRDVVYRSVPIHEHENSAKYKLIRKRDNYFYRYGLKHADAVVVQSEFQRKELVMKMRSLMKFLIEKKRNIQLIVIISKGI